MIENQNQEYASVAHSEKWSQDPQHVIRRRAAGVFAGLALFSGLAETNGGFRQIAHNATKLPDHIAWVFSDRGPDQKPQQ